MIANKDMQVLMLTNQLKAHGDAPIDEVVALSEARSRLTAALTKLMEGDESAQVSDGGVTLFVHSVHVCIPPLTYVCDPRTTSTNGANSSSTTPRPSPKRHSKKRTG